MSGGHTHIWEYKRLMFRIFLLLMGLSLALSGVPVAHAAGALALGYEPKYPEGFEHFDYVNPNAPRGGHLTLSALGNFSSLNPFLLRGTGAAGLDPLVFETLMDSSLDEPFSQYGLLAEDAELAEDRLSITYRINPDARFSDGSPVTAQDVKFSFDTLKSSQAHPQFRIYWSDIERAVVLGERTLRFEFAQVNPELHMIAGQIPVFSERWVGDRSFDEVVLDEPVASGPYRVESYDLGKSITYRRKPDYWASNLGVRRGMFNFERVTFRYYRDSTVQLEAFKAGEFDFNLVNNSKQWARDYTGSKFENGPIQKTTFDHQNNLGMQGFAFNLRRPIFQDKRVRRAITLAFDFEWANRNLFYDQYERCDSYFSNSELAATGLPSGDELALLELYRDQLSPEIFTKEWEPPSVEPHGLRKNLIEAQRLLNEAGWHYRDGALRNADGRPFQIDLMLFQKGFLRIAAPFARNLAKLGIEMKYRTVDAALYERRAKSFDFDMMVASFGQSQSPGNELIGTFHSQSADQEGSRNLMGIQDPVVDALVEKVVFAPDRDALVTAVHALDRVLLNGEYLVPNWYIAEHRVAFRKRLAHPDTLPLYYNATDWALETWWLPEQPTETGS